MYLNRNFHSNPTLSHSRFRYFIVDIYTFFSKDVETLGELEGMSQDFWLGFQDFRISAHAPCPLRVSVKTFHGQADW